jgi:hypothetical protein
VKRKIYLRSARGICPDVGVHAKQTKNMIPEIKLACYRKSDWEKLMRSIVDRDSMHDTWDEWNQEYNRAKKILKDRGLVVHDITIDIDALSQYCLERGLKNDGETRSKYVSQLPISKKRKK